MADSDAHQITNDGMPGGSEGPGEEAESVGQIRCSDGDGAKQRKTNMSVTGFKVGWSALVETGQCERWGPHGFSRDHRYTKAKDRGAERKGCGESGARSWSRQKQTFRQHQN